MSNAQARNAEPLRLPFKGVSLIAAELRRHIVWSANDSTSHVERFVECLRDAKVAHFDSVITIQEEILRLQVPVQDAALLVDEVERDEKLHNPAHREVVWESRSPGCALLLAQARPEVPVRSKLHDNAQKALVAQRLVISRHIRVLNLGQTVGLVDRILALLAADAAHSHAFRDQQRTIAAPPDQRSHAE